MEIVLKAAAGALVASILCLALDKREISALLAMSACVMLLLPAVTYLSPVLDFLRELEELGSLNGSMVAILFKVTGIGLLSEIAGMICADAGNASLGKALHILCTAVILWQSIPIFQALLGLIQQILGEV